MMVLLINLAMKLVKGKLHPRKRCGRNLSSSTSELVRCKVVNGRYVSPFCRYNNHTLGEVFAWKMKNALSPTSFIHKLTSNLDILKPIKIDMANVMTKVEPHVTWIGHSTCWFHIDGLHFVTDPLWSRRASPTQWFGPDRLVDVSIEVEDLPIDIVLLSHTHYDHLDIPTAKRIGNRALWIVPLGVKAILASNGITNCKELNWWESVTIPCKGRNENIEVILTPAKHWSSRTLFDRNTTLWGSFSVIHKDCRLFFGGDTAYCPIFKTIGEKYGPFDISLIPIGAYKPRSILKDAHCDPAEAIQIHFDLKSKTSLGIHWGTFNLADDESVEPPLELGRIRNSIRLSSKEFFTAMHGETISISQASQFDIASLYPELLTRYSNYLLQNISYLDKFEFEIINSSTNRSTFVTSFEKSSLN